MAPNINKLAPIQNLAPKVNKMAPIQNVASKINKMAPKIDKMAPIQCPPVWWPWWPGLWLSWLGWPWWPWKECQFGQLFNFINNSLLTDRWIYSYLSKSRMYWAVLGCTELHVTGCARLYWAARLCWADLGCSGMWCPKQYLAVLGCNGLSYAILDCTWLYWAVLGYGPS